MEDFSASFLPLLEKKQAIFRPPIFLGQEILLGPVLSYLAVNSAHLATVVTLYRFQAPRTHFRIGRHEKKNAFSTLIVEHLFGPNLVDRYRK
jgi:hypothetical protein